MIWRECLLVPFDIASIHWRVDHPARNASEYWLYQKARVNTRASSFQTKFADNLAFMLLTRIFGQTFSLVLRQFVFRRTASV